MSSIELKILCAKSTGCYVINWMKKQKRKIFQFLIKQIAICCWTRNRNESKVTKEHRNSFNAENSTLYDD